MTDLSDRERKLVEAAKAARDASAKYGVIPLYQLGIQRALRAYDPPRKRYTMPTWDEFADRQPSYALRNVSSEHYNAI